jgi:aminopeptidase N
VTLWEDVLQGRADAQAWMDLALRALAREGDELNIARLAGYTAGVFWRHLAPEARDRQAAALERVLRDGMEAAKVRTAKAAWFQALTRVARTPATVAWMERVWRREEKIDGLPLAEPDEISLAQELAVREVAGWREVLDTQAGRITNADRRARFAFIGPALDADPTVRDRFFESLAEVANRRREPWVLEALSYLHHPLRAGRSARYVPTSLEMLEEIQRTGDIFFPKRWLDATLSGHASIEVADMVRSYLRSRPDLSTRLRRIVEQSSDELFRITTARAAAVPAAEQRR